MERRKSTAYPSKPASISVCTSYGKVVAPDSEPSRVARATSFQFVFMALSFRGGVRNVRRQSTGTDLRPRFVTIPRKMRSSAARSLGAKWSKNSASLASASAASSGTSASYRDAHSASSTGFSLRPL